MIRLVHKLQAAAGDDVVTTLTLPFDARNKSRQRVVLDNGDTAALLLPRGTVLQADDRLIDAEYRYRVRVRAAEEWLSVVVCADRQLLNRVCYHLGNRHVPLQVMADRVCYRHDHVLDDMVSGLGVAPCGERRAFQPEPGAYGHAHGHRSHDPHSHGHD